MNQIKNISITFLVTLLLSFSINGQESNKIKGYIVNKATHKTLPYAKIYNFSTNSGTVSNYNGYFEISTNNLTDSIVCMYIGFYPYQIKLNQSKTEYIVYLEESTQILDKVVVSAGNEPYLYDLLLQCKKKQSKQSKNTKAYYELKSEINTETIEIVENFYNATLTGYDLTLLDLKAGRFGLQFYDNRSFVSLESSRAILKHQLFEYSYLFPVSPLQLKKKKLKKRFNVKLEKTYLDENSDSIMILNLSPKTEKNKYFKARIWIRPKYSEFIKVELICEDAYRYPFIPIFFVDSITDFNLFITKTFKKIEEEMFLEHIDFNYSLSYKYRNTDSYNIKTHAVIEIYDFDSVFFKPKFNFSSSNIGDYQKINAFPYNPFFWMHNNELKLHHLGNDNEKFMNAPETSTNKIIFTPNDVIKQGLLENPFIKWSVNRIKFKNVNPNTKSNIKKSSATKNYGSYNFGVKIFLDYNNYLDSNVVLTSTIFDPYESYYYLEVTKQVNCFINIYFDLIEIERRLLEKNINSTPITINNVNQHYKNCQDRITRINNTYFKQIARGNNQTKMERWNKIVVDELGINNIDFFEPFKDE